MEFYVEKSEFITALSKVQSIVERKTTLAVLSNILLSAQSDSIVISATDLELGFEGLYPAKVREEGSVTIPAKKIYEIVKELNSKEVYIKEQENNRIFISGDDAKYILYGLPASDFPGLPEVSQLAEISINAHQLRKMIQCTIFSVSVEDSMYNTNGVYLEKYSRNEKINLRMVSTDGHRLSIIDNDVKNAELLDFVKGIVISKKGITEIQRLIEHEESVLIGFSEKAGMIKTKRDTLVMRLLDKNYPDYTKAIPQQQEHEIKLSRLPFLEMLRRMSIMATEKYKGIRVDIKPQSIEVFSINPELGDAREKKGIQYEGPEMSFGFNPRYLIDVLSVLESEEITIRFSDENTGFVISGELDSGFLGMVMPMAIS